MVIVLPSIYMYCVITCPGHNIVVSLWTLSTCLVSLLCKCPSYLIFNQLLRFINPWCMREGYSSQSVVYLSVAMLAATYHKSENFCCKNIFIVDGSYEINLTKMHVHC